MLDRAADSTTLYVVCEEGELVLAHGLALLVAKDPEVRGPESSWMKPSG